MNPRHAVAVLLAAATLAAPAGAQPGDKTYIDIKARAKGTTEWLDSVTVDGGGYENPVDVEVAVFYYRNTGDGLATVVHNILVNGIGGSAWKPAIGDSFTILDRADSSQHPDGRQGNFNFGGQAQDGYTSANSATNDTGRLRIAAKNNTQDAPGGGISVKQNTPVALGTNFDARDGVMGFRFDLRLVADEATAYDRRFEIDAPKNRVNAYRVYQSAIDLPTDLLPSLLDTDKAFIHAVWTPAPGTLAPLGLAALLLPRRRRRD